MLSLRFKILLSFLTKNKKEYTIPRSTRQRVYVFLAADYGNLGDVAITYAQTEYLKRSYPNAEIVEIPISKTLSGIKAVKSVIKPEDIITIVGGGNMGDLYDDIEFLRELVILSFRRNKIISFPQTMDFSSTFVGKCHLCFAEFVYSLHNNLVILAREEISYNNMKKYFRKADVRLTPDIVMTLDKRRHSESRKGVTLCLRNDSERKFDVRDEIVGLLKANGIEYIDYDTHIGRGNLSVEERLAELDKIWSAFSDSELVVTDRLHGMIFAFITGTPAVVLPNSNFKVRSCFEWIKDCGYIRLLENPETLENELQNISNCKDQHFDEVHGKIISAFSSL